MYIKVLSVLICLLMAVPAWSGTITRPVKSNGLTSFTNGMVPQDSDLNGDPNTIYAEFNGNISNVNISASAAIAATKINPDGFTANVRATSTQPCFVADESDQGVDLKRWAFCSISGVFSLGTYTDAGALQNNWFTITRANGGFVLGGSGGTNTIQGATTFSNTVTFSGANNLLPSGTLMPYVGTSAPAGWLLADGSSNSCTGSAGVNANLCAQMVSVFGTVNYKGSSTAAFTVDAASNEIIHVAHGKSTNDRVHFSTTTTLPGGLSATIVYCIISTTTDRFKISTTCGGSEVDITSTGSGTHSDYFNFLVPDTRGRALIGAGSGAGLSARTLGQTGGEETHVLSMGEMPAHTHTYTAPQNAINNVAGGAQPAVNGTSAGQNTGSAGSGSAHNVMDPFLVLQYIIKL